MDIGLRQGYDFVEANQTSERSDRVMLFTDALPKTGKYSRDHFAGMVSEGADLGVGLTAFGVGLDFDLELIDFIAIHHGGNYFYLKDEERISTIFDKDFDFMVTPIAYDLTVTVEEGKGFTVEDAYGFPGVDEDLQLCVTTVFLSRERGAMLLKFEHDAAASPLVSNGALIAHLDMSYEDVSGDSQLSDMNVLFTGSDVMDTSAHTFSQDSVRKTVTLAREVITMQKACKLYHANDVDSAIELLLALETYLEDEITAAGETDLEAERQLVQKLIENMGG